MPDLTQIPPALRKYANDILSGLSAVQLKRSEYRFNHPEARRSEPVAITIPQAEIPPIVLSSQPAEPVYPDTVKLWPLVGLAALRSNHGGAWRAWVYARALDPEGSGKVSRAALWGFLTCLKIGERKRRRWLADALSLGLLREYRDVYYLSSLATGALALGCLFIGRPAVVSALSLAESGWRARVWAGYLTSVDGRLISQETKEQLTGVSERTQRNYQAAVPGCARTNYAEVDHPADHVEGLREFTRHNYFVGNNGRVYQRLPDCREVPGFVAKQSSRGRSRKAQRAVNISSSVRREPNHPVRLFCESAKQLKSSLRNIQRSEIPPWELPGEVFELLKAGRNSNHWRSLPVGGLQA